MTDWEKKHGAQAWRDAFDAIDEPIFLHDSEFRVLRANRAYAEIAGLPFEAIIGRPYWQVFPKDDGPLPGCKKALEQAAYETVTEDIRLPDGRYLVSRSFYATDDEGECRYSVHVLTDMSAIEKALANARHENRLRRTVSASNRSLIRAKDEAALLDAICKAAVHEAGFAEAGVAFIEHDEHKSMCVMACAGPHCAELKAMPLSWDQPAGTSAAAEAIRSGCYFVFHDLLEVAEGSLSRMLGEKLGYRSEIALPLKDGEQVFGVFVVAGVEANAFTEIEIELLGELAGDMAYGILALRGEIRREQTEQQRLKLVSQLETSLDKTVLAISRTLEMRDPYTSGHQQRVAELAEAIAREMGLDENSVQGVRITGFIHDLGKIAIPADMLVKPARLTAVEFEMIKTHPQAGYDILRDIDFPWPVAEAILQHHERLDGSGYPQGLKGDEIITEARILAVADTVEAMASHRPYRPACSMEKVLATIEKKRGSKLDAEVVDACLRLFRERRFVWS